MKKLIAFDFDGTLVDSRPTIKPAAIEYSRISGYPMPNFDAICHGYMDPDAYDYEWGIDRADQGQRIIDFFDWIDEQCTGHGQYVPVMFDGVHDTLAELNNDYVLVIVTSRPEPSTNAILNHHGMHELFSGFRTSTDIKRLGLRDKPAPDKLHSIMDEMGYDADNVVMIGDTCADINMAHAAGVKCVAVEWGFQDASHIAAQNPTHVANSVTDLRPLIKRAFEE